MDVSDLKNVNSTQVKEKQINPLEPNNPQATNSPCGAGASQHQDDNKGNQHIMISYSWNDSKDLIYKISDELSAAGYKVWIDKNEMKGNIYDKMYEAVDDAYLVLMFLSENYKLSENCKREGKLAADKRKRIIPIITQDNYKMDGWTALLVSGKFYYDFSKESFEDNFDKLTQEIDQPNEQYQFTKCLEANKADHRKLGKRDEAIGKVLQEQNKRREDDIRLQAGIDVSVEDIPVVHPKYTKVSYFQGRAVPEYETYAPSTGEPDTFEQDENIEFEELLKSTNRFTAFIGYPGSGKTTLSKRLAKTEEYTCLYYKFMEMPIGEKVSFRKLIMDNIYPDLDETTREDAWEWIKENQKSCLLLFDGLDQAEWSFQDKVPKVDYDTPQNVPILIANLCNKHFLPDIKLVFTSRPHSVITLPAPLRPGSTILLGDLPLDGMKELFYFYAGASADKLWNDLSRNAKIVFALCYNPLLLQLVIAAGLAPTTKFGKISTTTRVFATVLENLRCSEHAKHQDITLLVKQLSKLAYRATMRSSVVITRDDLRAVGLEPEQIQDIVVGIYAHFAAVSRVFDGHVKYYFAHQLYQEFFTAKFIVNELPLDTFKNLVSNELFFDEKWSVVRRFVCGLLIDMMKDSSISKIAATGHEQRDGSCMTSLPFKRLDEQISLTQELAEEKIPSPDHQSSALLSGWFSQQQAYKKTSFLSDIAEKRRIWIEALKSQLVRFEEMQYKDCSVEENRRYISLLCDLKESSNLAMFNMASLHFSRELDLSGLKLSSSEAAIFCDVLRKQQNELKLLNLMSCFSSGDVERLISAISEMPGRVKELDIVGNIIKDIPEPEFFAKIDERLYMAGCFENGRIFPNSSEKQEIQLALDQLHDSQLKVRVGDAILTSRKHC
ncbi:NACHT, LRR and PYD domains-containing protein 1a allele 3-like isoform X3 [Clavelina lepadiformis]|uniref:NACHT, LRR and PYD domains-containing protein 1a allele 3-like isoform X3 n=1 Tax=Clavelina lepadiformis TaxID=159417 RepID=UPI0040424F0F